MGKTVSVVCTHVFGPWNLCLGMSQHENFHPTLLLILEVSGMLVSMNSSVCGAQRLLMVVNIQHCVY